MSVDSVVARLEAVATRLEQLAAKGGAGAGAHAAAAAGGDEKGPSNAAYDAFYDERVTPFLATCGKMKELAPVGDLSKRAFEGLRNIIVIASQSKKPSQADFGKLLTPLVEVLTGAEKLCDNRHSHFNHYKAFSEAIICLNWVTVDLPFPFIKGQLEAADFYLSKILSAAKNAPAGEADVHRSYVKQLKELLEGLAAYAKANHTTGLTWNPRGGDIKDAKSGGAAPQAAAAAAAPQAAAADAPKAGLGAVFGQLNAGLDITKGLNKVTSDMKAKNQKDKPVLAPKAEPQAAPKAKKEEEPAKPASITEKQGTWFIEHYRNDQTVTLKDADQKQAVYIFDCNNSVITIPPKVKSIQVDKCTKTTIVVDSVVSTLNTVNCKSLHLVITGSVPIVAVDKTHGCQVVLNDKSVASAPQLVTSNISEVNVLVPGKKAEDDPIELPVPEQFNTVYKNWTLTTTPVSHG